MLMFRVNFLNVSGEAGLYIGVFRRDGGVVLACEVQVVVAAVGAGYIGDVPDSVGTGCVKQRTARHGVGIAAYVFCAVALLRVRVVSTLFPVAALEPCALPVA